ncbi:MAG: hypothetical protein BWK80_04365 [Desulfobacteraceae bacterium IS3]|nr:MAG: hypothetical protein BWK80_04365 [Desulfobacteraceae bacterium IS3]
MKIDMRFKTAAAIVLAVLFVFTACSFAQQTNPAETGGNVVQGIENSTGTNANAGNTGNSFQEVDTTPLSGNTANGDSSDGVTVGNIIYSGENKDCIKGYHSGNVIIERVTRLDKKVDCVVKEEEVPSYNQPAK